MNYSIRRLLPRIYMDYAAATPLGRGARRALRRVRHLCANPSSIHSEGVRAHRELVRARTSIARACHVRADELFFTSGGTEGIATAIRGISSAAVTRLFPEVHIIAVALDHASITQTLADLESKGIQSTNVCVEYIPVDERGYVDPDAVVRAVRPTTALIVMTRIHGEIGIIQPTRDVARALVKKKEAMSRKEQDFPYLVVDACQAPVVDSIDRQHIGADVMVLDSIKCYGGSGAGVVMKRHFVPCDPLIHGGGQEGGMRSGTQNLAAIVACAGALDECSARRERDVAHMTVLRDALISGMISHAERQGKTISVNGFWKKGDTQRRCAHIASVCIAGISGEMLVLRLDARGYACSHASACASSSDDGASTAIAAFKPECASSSLRVSVGRDTRMRHVRGFLKAFAKSLEKC